MPACNLSLQIIPLVADEKIYPTVDLVIAMIAASGVKYQVGPMETTMEGELEQLLEIVKSAQAICENAGAKRVLSVVKIDYSPKGVTMDEKMVNYKR